MKIKDLVTSFPALQEFGRYANVILPVMKDPDIPREKKREMLNELTENISDKTLANKTVAEQIIRIINMQEEECKKFETAELQVEGILSWLPKMAIHRDMLLEEVSKHRRQYKLEV